MKQVILSLMSDEFPVKIQTSINISMPISPDKKYFGTLNCIVGAGGRREGFLFIKAKEV